MEQLRCMQCCWTWWHSVLQPNFYLFLVTIYKPVVKPCLSYLSLSRNIHMVWDGQTQSFLCWRMEFNLIRLSNWTKVTQRVIFDAFNKKPLCNRSHQSDLEWYTAIFTSSWFPQKTLKGLGSLLTVKRWSPTLWRDSLLCPWDLGGGVNDVVVLNNFTFIFSVVEKTTSSPTA